MNQSSAAKKVLTLCFVTDGERLLLGMKKRGFGAGKWNGFGGKINDGEGIESAALRELYEESGLQAIIGALRKCAVIDFVYTGQPMHEVHVYLVTEWTGEAGETDEMFPAWFTKDTIPYRDMWVDDEYWLPHVLAGRTVQGRFLFDADEKLLEHEIEFDLPLP